MLKKIVRKKKKEITLYTMLIFALVSLIYVAIAFIIQENQDSSKKSEIIKTEERLVEAERLIINNKVDRLISDALFIADTLKYYENDYSSGKLTEQWLDFSNRKRIYDQIRFIDMNGDEVIRVDYRDALAEVSAAEALQNKGDRYYFEDTTDIQKDQVYISRIDLNMENGVVEVPDKPMIRFSTPIYNAEEDFQGIVILNYLAEDILTQIANISETSLGEVFLCNEDGYWIYNGQDRSLEWAFMYEESMDVSFRNQFPEEWERILTEKSGSFVTELGAFSFTNTLVEDGSNRENFNDIVLGEGDWYVISYISPDTEDMGVLFHSTLDVVFHAISQSTMVFILLLFFSFIAAMFMLFNKEEQDEIRYFSEYDAMTGVYNRRAGFDKLRQIYDRYSDEDCHISICFIDINGLKEVNDTFGHDDGDDLIQTIVRVIINNIRDRDFVARFGGDEFVIIFEGLDTEAAEHVWDRIAAEYDHINQTEDRNYLVSASHGIETLACGSGESIDLTINRADEKMYEEKRQIKQEIKIIK